MAGWLRFAWLGRLSFWSDEFSHAVAARSLIHEGRPVLPSGMEYRRALAQTVAVSLSMRAFGETETAARLPSAIVGLATVPLLWLAVRRRFGDVAGLAAAAVLAVMPLYVAHSRSARFYAAFALAYVGASMLGARAIETRSPRTAIAALVAFGIALHLQIEAVMVFAPLAVIAVLHARSAPDRERSRSDRAVVAVVAAAAIAAGLLIALPQTRNGVARLLEHPVPGLEFHIGFQLSTLGRLFHLIAWWAWVPLAPAAIVGLRRAGPEGRNLALQLILPAILLAVLFRPEEGARFDRRYILHLVPFLAAAAGVGVAEILRLARAGAESMVARPVAVVAGALCVSRFLGVWSIPGAGHPGPEIPRPNWNAAGAAVRAGVQHGDALLSTTPLALAWTTGHCGDWMRTPAAAASYLKGDRDIYCGSTLIPDGPATSAYLDAHARGWVVADPSIWGVWVDPAARAVIESRAAVVNVGDPSVLVWRWGG